MLDDLQYKRIKNRIAVKICLRMVGDAAAQASGQLGQ
jgi:hypothetical protein